MTDTCTNDQHDHALMENELPGKCNDCELPAHFDEGTGWYHHDDPDAPPCFLTSAHTVKGKTPCILDTPGHG